MAANTSTSTTITFAIVSNESGSAVDSSVRVELDDDANGGKTTFKSGDTVYFIVFKNPSNLVIDTWSTFGTVTALGNKTAAREETLTFVGESTKELSYMPSGTVTMDWLGLSTCGTTSNTGAVISTQNTGNGVLNCSYSAIGTQYKLSGVTIPSGLSELQVLVVLTASAPAV